DLVDALSRRERDGICHYELAKRRALDALNCSPRQHAVDDPRFHRDSAVFEYKARGLHEGAPARHFVIDDERDFPLDVTDQIYSARDLVVPGASLVHNRDWRIQGGRVWGAVFRLTHVAGDEHVVRQVTALAQVVT